MTSKLAPPQLADETVEGYDKFILQFERFLRLTKVDEKDRLDLLLLCVGARAAAYYDEVTWPELSEDDKKDGITVYSRAVKFLRNKLSGDKNVSVCTLTIN